MRIFKWAAIASFCSWFLWNVFSAAFLTHRCGLSGWGGFPTTDRQQLRDFLTNQGFTRCPPSDSQTTASFQECYRGSYHGSRLFIVKITTETNNDFGIYVETDYDFKGYTRSVDASVDKVQKFTGMLDPWLTDHRMDKFKARSQAAHAS